jgi:hypothetical protein
MASFRLSGLMRSRKARSNLPQHPSERPLQLRQSSLVISKWSDVVTETDWLVNYHGLLIIHLPGVDNHPGIHQLITQYEIRRNYPELDAMGKNRTK